MKSVRDEGLIIMREVETAQRTFETVQTRLNQTSLEGQTTQSNVNVLNQADPPLLPSSPKILLNTLLAVFLGTLLSIGTALLLELMDRRVRNIDDIVTALDLPVIGVMPKPGSTKSGRKQQVSLLQQRLMAPMPPATKGA
jgi:polysaccharide biosynthesis transport protein